MLYLKVEAGSPARFGKDLELPGDSCRYVTYVSAPAERVWQAILDGHMARSGAATPGGPDGFAGWAGGFVPVPVPGLVGEVVEADSPRRLVLCWGTPGRPARTRVTFELEPVGEMVRLTVVHDGPRGGRSGRRAAAPGSWPKALADLKTDLEGGSTLCASRARNA